MMKTLQIFFLIFMWSGELCEVVYEAEKQMNVIIKNSLSDHDIKFFGSYLLENYHMKIMC